MAAARAAAAEAAGAARGKEIELRERLTAAETRAARMEAGPDDARLAVHHVRTRVSSARVHLVTLVSMMWLTLRAGLCRRSLPHRLAGPGARHRPAPRHPRLRPRRGRVSDARRVIPHLLSGAHFLTELSLYDVASMIHLALRRAHAPSTPYSVSSQDAAPPPPPAPPTPAPPAEDRVHATLAALLEAAAAREGDLRGQLAAATARVHHLEREKQEQDLAAHTQAQTQAREQSQMQEQALATQYQLQQHAPGSVPGATPGSATPPPTPGTSFAAVPGAVGQATPQPMFGGSPMAGGADPGYVHPMLGAMLAGEGTPGGASLASTAAESGVAVGALAAALEAAGEREGHLTARLNAAEIRAAAADAATATAAATDAAALSAAADASAVRERELKSRLDEAEARVTALAADPEAARQAAKKSADAADQFASELAAAQDASADLERHMERTATAAATAEALGAAETAGAYDLAEAAETREAAANSALKRSEKHNGKLRAKTEHAEAAAAELAEELGAAKVVAAEAVRAAEAAAAASAKDRAYAAEKAAAAAAAAAALNALEGREGELAHRLAAAERLAASAAEVGTYEYRCLHDSPLVTVDRLSFLSQLASYDAVGTMHQSLQ